jgi:GNAT superfamily N-acetyltransferase
MTALQHVRDSLRPIYWSLHHQISTRTLAFFVSERQSQLPRLDQAEIRFGNVGHEDIVERLARLRGHDADEYRARPAGGHCVIYALGADGDIQSWGWVTAPVDAAQDAHWEFGIHLRVRPGAGFLWDYFTMPKYRGRGLYKTLLRHSAEQCFIRGASRAWGYADVTNSASRRGLMSSDYIGDTEIRLSRFGPFCRIVRPGLQCTVRVGGVLELDALLPHAR